MPKIALVTGGAIRLGKAIALELSRAGYRLAIHYHGHAREAKAFSRKLAASTLHQADLADSTFIAPLIQEVVAAHGHIDLLVNSAAIFYPTPLGTVTAEQWDRLHHINLRAPFFLVQAARPHMPSGSSVVNIADVSGEAPLPKYVPYGTTKAALLSMTRGLARELAPGIRVNAVSPGPVLLPENYTARQRNTSIERTLLKREGKPEDIARAVRFLAENDYVTGAVLAVDGGRQLA